MSKITMFPLKETTSMLFTSYKYSLLCYSGDVTKVGLLGFIEKTKWMQIPIKTINETPKFIKITQGFYKNKIGYYIKSMGKSIKHKDDKYDTAYGRHLAETRAKYNLFKFMYKWTDTVSKVVTDTYGMLPNKQFTTKDTLNNDRLKFKHLTESEKIHLEYLLGLSNSQVNK